AVDFTAPPEQVAQRDLGLEGVLVELGDVQEQLDGLVRLLAEQVVQAAEIGGGEFADLAVAVALAATTADDPAAQGRDREQQEKPEPFGDEGHVNVHPWCGGPAPAGAGAAAAPPKPSSPGRRRSRRAAGCPGGR